MAGYSARQSSYTTGDTITAAHSNDEFNQVLAAFNATTGHTHDGTAGEGGPVGSIRDADSLNKVLDDSTNNHLEFYVEVSSAAVQQLRIQDGAIVPITDNDIDLGTSSLEFKDLFIDGTANVDAINLDGTAITATAAEINILDGVTATATELNIIDGDTSASSTTVVDADRVVLNDGGTMKQVAVTDLSAYFDDEITAMPNLTSVGTLTTLTVDNIIINGTNIGHTSDTDALAIDSSGNVTASQNLTVTGDLTVSGDDITMGTNTAGNLLIADGTNFNSVAATSLSEISTVANDDVFIAVDTSGGGLKKIARSAIVAGLATSSAISNVVEDTTPQLGGNLDMNGADIVTTSNADLELAPNGTGHVTIKGNDNPGTIQFNCENNSHGQQIKAAAHSIGSSAVVTIPDLTGDMIVGKFGGTNFARSFLIGHSTTGTLSSAEDNLGIGDAALDSVTSGDQNICLGSNAGTAITTGGSNVYIGRNSGSGNATGSSNFGLGVDCLEDGSFTGSSNVALGRSAGAQVESGNYNILIGQSAGDNITTGHGNLIIGATVDAASATGSRQLKIAGYDGSTPTTWISGDSNGVVTLADDLVIKDGGTIGVSSDADSISIASNGVVTFSQTPVNSAGTAFVTEDPTALAIALG